MKVFVRMRYSHALRFVPCSKLPEGGERLREGLLHEVAGVGRVARHPQGSGVQLVHEGDRLFGEQPPEFIGGSAGLGGRLGAGLVIHRPRV